MDSTQLGTEKLSLQLIVMHLKLATVGWESMSGGIHTRSKRMVPFYLLSLGKLLHLKQGSFASTYSDSYPGSMDPPHKKKLIPTYLIGGGGGSRGYVRALQGPVPCYIAVYYVVYLQSLTSYRRSSFKGPSYDNA